MTETEAQTGLLGAIGQIAVPVRELDRAVAFYRDVLGLRFLFEVPGMAFFDCGGQRLLLGVPESEEFDHRASILYYTVTGIEAAHATLAERGVSFRRPPHRVADLGTKVLWLAFFGDSEGNVAALMEEVPKSRVVE